MIDEIKAYVNSDIDMTKSIGSDMIINSLFYAVNNTGGQPAKLVVGGQIFDVAIETVNVDRFYSTSYPDVDIKTHLLFPYGTKKKSVTRTYANGVPRIRNVIFNDPATIVFWEDGTKTVVKCDPEYDFYDPEKGLTMAIVKKMYGNKGNYFNEIKKWTKEYYEKEAEKNDGTISVSFETMLANIEKLKQSLNIKSPSEEETKE